MLTVVLASGGAAQAAQRPSNIYDVLLHSSSLSEQRLALATVLATPREYVPRIRQTLRTYAKQLKNDPLAANRAVYVAALVRDASFIPLLVKLLDDPNVVDECLYSCAPVFALSVYANFGGWRIPANLSSNRAPVADLRSSMQWVPRLTFEKRPIEEVVGGPWLQEHKKEIEGKTEEELIEMAGPATASIDARQLAAYELEVSISRSKNRVDIYLLAMNDIRDTASREYLAAVHTAAFRAELPPYGPRAVSFPTEWESRSQEGLVVEFSSPSGEKWVGNFKPGGGGVDGVRPHPNGAEVLVMAAGSVWSVDPFSRDAIELAVAVDETWPVNDPEGVIFSLQGLAFLRLGPSGILWRTRQISWDGFRHIELSEDALTGEAWSAIDDSWIPFGVDLHTGVVTGGANPESAAH